MKNGSMHVLVTGGSGFLGSHVAEQLAKKGHAVRCLVRKSSDTSFLKEISGVELAYGAVEDKDAVAKAVAGVEAIVHCAGLVKAKKPADFVATNVDGTRNLLEVALDRRKETRRFVFVSSLAAHGPSDDGAPIALDRDPRPVTEYGRSKLAAEKLVTAAKDDLEVTTIRPPAIYGPRDREMFVFFESVAKGFVPIPNASQKLSMIYGEDAASACVRALEVDHESGRGYYVEDGAVYTQPEMIDALERVLAKKPLRMSVPLGLLKVAAHASALYGRVLDKAMMFTPDKVNELGAPHWVCSAESTRRELGWVPSVQWEEGARRTAEWYRGAGWIR